MTHYALDPMISEVPSRLRPMTEAQVRHIGWDKSIELELERRESVIKWLTAEPSARPLVRRMCAESPLLLVSNFGWGYDPRVDGEQLQPLILMEDQILYLLALVNPSSGRLLVEKSRDRGATVLLAWAIISTWGFQRGYDWGVLTRVGKELDNGTYNSIFGKLDHALEIIPPFILSPDSWIRKAGHTPTLINKKTGSIVRGGATTSGTLRGDRYRRVAVDEAAHIQRLDRMMPALYGLTRNLVLLSSVNGPSGAFADIRHGRDGVVSAPFDPRQLRSSQGAGTGPLSGRWSVMRLHYSGDARRDEAWAAAERATMGEQVWAQEYEINYQTSARWRVFPNLDVTALTYTQDDWDEIWDMVSRSGRIINAWDFGSGVSLTCYTSSVYVESEDTLIFFKHRSWQGATYNEVADGYVSDGWRSASSPGGLSPDVLIGDNAGRARNSHQTSWIEDLRTRGLDIDGRTIWNVEASIQLARKKLAEGKIYFAPDCHQRTGRSLPSLADSLSGWRYAVSANGEANDKTKPEKSCLESHLCDTFLYAVEEVWGSNRTRIKKMKAQR